MGWSPGPEVCQTNDLSSHMCSPIFSYFIFLSRFLQSSTEVQSPAVPCSSQQSAAQSPRTGAEFPRLEKTTATRMPKLGRGISEGDDVLFFDESPPPKPKLGAAAEAKKVAGVWGYSSLMKCLLCVRT